MGKKVKVQFDGQTHWYDQEEEKALTKFRNDQRKVVEGPMVTAMREWIEEHKGDDLYDAKLLMELMNYPESVREEFGVTSAREGKIEKKESLVEKMAPLQEELNSAHWQLQQYIAKYPLTPDEAFEKPETMPDQEYQDWYCEFKRLDPYQAFGPDGAYWDDPIPKPKLSSKGHQDKDPYFPFPKPGELYNCGKMEPSGMLMGVGTGKPILFGTGGEINQYDNFKDLFHNPYEAPFKWHEMPAVDRTTPVYPQYYPENRFSVRYGFVDMSKEGEFEEYIGTYPRKMLLLL